MSIRTSEKFKLSLDSVILYNKTIYFGNHLSFILIMERGKFIKTISASSLACLAANAIASGIRLQPELENYKCKITVLRKSFHDDLYEKYPYGAASGCGRFEEGQVFITENVWDPPKNFCTWAWSDLKFLIHSIHAGNPGPMIGSCTDGLRPVLFKFERFIEKI